MKRIATAALWMLSVWYLGSAVAVLLGIPDLLGPVLGLAAGLIIGIDPRRILWRRTSNMAAAGA